MFISFCPIVNPTQHNYQNCCAVSDTMTTLCHTYMAALSSPPKAYDTLWEYLDGEDKYHWIQAAFQQYSKNQMVNLCSKEGTDFPSSLKNQVQGK